MRLKIAVALFLIMVVLFAVIVCGSLCILAAIESWQLETSFGNSWIGYWNRLWPILVAMWVILYTVALQITIKQVEAKDV
jgi:hypothetical protein